MRQSTTIYEMNGIISGKNTRPISRQNLDNRKISGNMMISAIPNKTNILPSINSDIKSI